MVVTVTNAVWTRLTS